MDKEVGSKDRQDRLTLYPSQEKNKTRQKKEKTSTLLNVPEKELPKSTVSDTPFICFVVSDTSPVSSSREKHRQ